MDDAPDGPGDSAVGTAGRARGRRRANQTSTQDHGNQVVGQEQASTASVRPRRSRAGLVVAVTGASSAAGARMVARLATAEGVRKVIALDVTALDVIAWDEARRVGPAANPAGATADVAWRTVDITDPGSLPRSTASTSWSIGSSSRATPARAAQLAAETRPHVGGRGRCRRGP